MKGYNNNRIHDSARCVRRNSILLKLQLQPKLQVPDLSVNLFCWRQCNLEVSLVSARLNLLLVLLLACRETRVLIRTSILSPRDSTFSQRSNSVLSIQVISNSASIIFVHRPHFCCTDVALLFACF